MRIKAIAVAVVLAGMAAGAQAQQANMGFFVTSTVSGKGADFGGLAGADAFCQKLAAAAGAGNKTWRAYLSHAGGGRRRRPSMRRTASARVRGRT